MYYQSCRFCLICTNTYVTLDFHTIHLDPSTSFFFFIVREVVFVAFCGNNASLYCGVGVFFPSGSRHNLCQSITQIAIAVELSLNCEQV